MMMKSQLHKPPTPFSLLPNSSMNNILMSRHGSPCSSLINTTLPHHHVQFVPLKHRKNSTIRASSGDFKPKASTTTVVTSTEKSVTVIVRVVTVKVTDFLSTTFRLELLSTEINPENGELKETIKGYAQKVSQNEDEVIYETSLEIPAGFGEVGAVKVENEHHKEIYIKSIELTGFPNGSVSVPCNSWVHSKYDNPDKRIFFTNKSYLPSETPSGLKRVRELELQNLRGNGEGERKTFERIYDYDTYNDLGDPDTKEELARPVLGSEDHPYPRRCRTGRPRCENDPLSEERSRIVYVPRDEAFAEVKQQTFIEANTLNSVLSALLPHLKTDPHQGFPSFTDIDSLFNKGVTLPEPQNNGFFQSIISTLEDLLLFNKPELIKRDKFAWLRDEEFSRQTLAGLNPYSIQLVTEWPLKSKLDPKVYGPPESLITTELVEFAIRGKMTVNEALKGKKLFMLDYHDLLMPYVNKVRELEGTTLYGSRTLFFLTEDGTLRPIAIELTRPPVGDKPQWKQVFTPTTDATGMWLWRHAKAHVCVHDGGYHQLVIHWLRTHCCTEPYIIAAHRQLSAMHPIYRLLHPHFRYTMQINALARGNLINAGGIIESSFSPGEYSIEVSSAVYHQLWRFDMEALPADLIGRGMAVEDPTAEHGLKLAIEDYPFANDGLILWDAIKQWVSDYVNHYYPYPTLVESDTELQAWWTEVRTKGHADKKDEPWWPVLKTPENLIHILTTIIWVTAGHHAAVNFGQYMYAGYFPNRPTIARTNMPTEDPSEEFFRDFIKKPEVALLNCFPSQIQATKVMVILELLSNHSPDEEYIGEKMKSPWAENPVIKAAFERFSDKMKKLEGTIDERNTNPKLKNRVGAGVVPYQLLKPFSKPGVTGMGVPNSISI